ncbi:MAG: nicotinate (nicotinamide) nucleotide adenylyltransferase [Clostridia bacterium]
MEKIAIFGGTFDPPHKAHLQIIKLALSQLKADRFIVLPSGVPPHKNIVTKKEQRYDMAQIAFGKYAQVSDYEIKMQCKNYTVDTVKYFHNLYGEKPYFIMGADSLNDLSKWYNPKIIVANADIAVFDRYKFDTEKIINKANETFDANFIHLKGQIDDISSLEIRLKLSFGIDVSDYVDKDVLKYITQNEMYSNYKEYIDKLKKSLTIQRFEHTYYTIKKGLELNKYIKEDEDRVFIACLLHDCAKYIQPSEYSKYGYIPQEYVPQEVTHAFLGRYVAKKDYGIDDEEILSAIEFHTTAKPNMSNLEKAVYMADFMEDSRGEYAEFARKKLAENGFDNAFIEILKYNYDYNLNKRNGDLCNLTKKALEYYCAT